SRGDKGKALLSWRVHLLPFLGEDKLHKEFHLDEPWDSAHNKKLVERMPAVYRSSLKLPAGKTTFLAARGIGTMWPETAKSLTFSEVTDGTSNTIFLLDADDDRAVFWTQPEDLKYDMKKPHAGLGGRYGGGFLALFVDGSVYFIRKDVPDMTLKALVTPN